MAIGKTLSVDPQKVNANGSAIALGHPLAPAEHEFGGETGLCAARRRSDAGAGRGRLSVWEWGPLLSDK
ncbi:hypothetical protein [Edwardsiella tarda]